MTINVSEIVRKTMGWCPNAEMLNKKEEMYMVSYEEKYVDRIKGMGFRGFLGALHLVFAVWLISTALWVLAKVQMFPWYVMDINFISSGILLAVGVSSLIIFFNFVKSANVHRILALVNIALLVVFSLYLSLSLISFESMQYISEFLYSVFIRPYYHYTFGTLSLILFTLILGIPSIITFFSKPTGVRKTGFITATLLVLIIVFASLGTYYFYLNKQKDALLAEENGGYKLYRIEPGILDTRAYGTGVYPYFLDSTSGTTGHPVSKETYDAVQFLRNKERSMVLGWWDYELEIKASWKEPVIDYASKDIIHTIGRPSLLYDEFDSHEKVVDVIKFFTTDSEEVAKSIAESYGANFVYISRQRWHDLFLAMFFVANSGMNLQYQDVRSSEAFDKEFYEPTMAYKFNSGADLNYFGKVFENRDVIIYQLNDMAVR